MCIARDSAAQGISSCYLVVMGNEVRPSGLKWRWDACDREWQLERCGERVGYVILRNNTAGRWVGVSYTTGMVSFGALRQCALDLVESAFGAE